MDDLGAPPNYVLLSMVIIPNIGPLLNELPIKNCDFPLLFPIVPYDFPIYI